MKAVIFDMDGLLVDTESMSFAIYQTLLSPYQISLSKETYAQQYSGKTEETNLTNLLVTYRLPSTVPTLLKAVDLLEQDIISQGIALKRGARQLLTFLKSKGYLLALATSSAPDRAVKILSQHDLLNFFDEMVFGTEVERGKPHPDIFLTACHRLGVVPKEVLIFEDSEADLQSAYAAGAAAICIPDMKVPAPEILELASAVYSDLEEALDYFQSEINIKPSHLQ